MGLWTRSRRARPAHRVEHLLERIDTTVAADAAHPPHVQLGQVASLDDVQVPFQVLVVG